MGAMPGTLVSRDWKLLPLLRGRLLIELDSMVVEMSARSVCNSGGAVVTSTVSVALPGDRVTSTRVVVFVSRAMFERVSFLKPCATTVMAYVPEGRSGSV